MDAWLDRAAAELLAAGDDGGAIAAAFEEFLDEGMAVVHSPSAMWDYAGPAVSRAGY